MSPKSKKFLCPSTLKRQIMPSRQRRTSKASGSWSTEKQPTRQTCITTAPTTDRLSGHQRPSNLPKGVTPLPPTPNTQDARFMAVESSGPPKTSEFQTALYIGTKPMEVETVRRAQPVLVVTSGGATMGLPPPVEELEVPEEPDSPDSSSHNSLHIHSSQDSP